MIDTRVTVLLIDDHVIVRDGCRKLLEQAQYIVVGEASNGEDGYGLFLALLPQIVIVDLSMDGWGGLRTTKRILAHSPSTKVVVFTMHTDAVYATHALAAGAVAYVSKKSSPTLLIEALRYGLSGKRYLSPDLAQTLALSKIHDSDQPLDALSPREFEILQMLLAGHSVAEIATTASISSRSVTNCIIRIKRKLGARSTADLIRIAVGFGLLNPGPAILDNKDGLVR